MWVLGIRRRFFIRTYFMRKWQVVLAGFSAAECVWHYYNKKIYCGLKLKNIIKLFYFLFFSTFWLIMDGSSVEEQSKLINLSTVLIKQLTVIFVFSGLTAPFFLSELDGKGSHWTVFGKSKPGTVKCSRI